MALANFSLPFGSGLNTPNWAATVSPIQQVQQNSNTNGLLYGPAGHQESDLPSLDYYKNNPYLPPQGHQQYQHHLNRRKSGPTYLPPLPPSARIGAQQGGYDQRRTQQQIPQHQQQRQFNYQSQSSIGSQQQPQQPQQLQQPQQPQKPQQPSTARTYGEGSYTRFPPTQPQQVQQQLAQSSGTQDHTKLTLQQQRQLESQQTYFSSSYNTQSISSFTAGISSSNGQSQDEGQISGQIQGPTQSQGQSPTVNGGTYGANQQLDNNDQAPTVEVEKPPGGASVPVAPIGSGGSVLGSGSGGGNPNDPYPERPPGFTRVQAGQGSRTQVHAVLDYDVEEGEEADYYDEDDSGTPVQRDGGKKSPTVTPIQGPIFLKNGTVPVVPLFSYPTVNNGSFVQIPIWWTALSVALGLDIRGDVIKGVPCVKRYHQLFCPTAGNSYPIDKIERFIDDNKALMRRMYGDFEMNMDTGGPTQQTKRKRRFIDEPDLFIPPGAFPAVPEDIDSDHSTDKGETYFGKLRNKRQSSNRNPKLPFNRDNINAGQAGSSTGRLDACESKIEIVTPYWASNSAGKIRAIVNTQHFEQAIHQEICSKARTPRCEKDCGCEQKYKWHRLLAYDPDNDCKGIFMDWFLFPSCCVCRCNP